MGTISKIRRAHSVQAKAVMRSPLMSEGRSFRGGTTVEDPSTLFSRDRLGGLFNEVAPAQNPAQNDLFGLREIRSPGNAP